MTIITDEVINKTTNDYNLFLLLKKNMINGEIKLPNLSSKNRSILHQLCYNYGLEHFSTGNYKNRIIIIKDPSHTYFTDSNSQHFQILKSDKSTHKFEYNFISQPEKKDDKDEEYKKIKEEEVDEEIEEEDEEIEEEEVDTDTYSSDESECSECSDYTQTYQVAQNINISNQLNTLRMFSYINLIMNVIIICNL